MLEMTDYIKILLYILRGRSENHFVGNKKYQFKETVIFTSFGAFICTMPFIFVFWGEFF